jgi:hypothetical protein
MGFRGRGRGDEIVQLESGSNSLRMQRKGATKSVYGERYGMGWRRFGKVWGGEMKETGVDVAILAYP